MSVAPITVRTAYGVFVEYGPWWRSIVRTVPECLNFWRVNWTHCDPDGLPMPCISKPITKSGIKHDQDFLY